MNVYTMMNYFGVEKWSLNSQGNFYEYDYIHNINNYNDIVSLGSIMNACYLKLWTPSLVKEGSFYHFT